MMVTTCNKICLVLQVFVGVDLVVPVVRADNFFYLDFGSQHFL